ncbi:hypothetical protein AAFF_G00347760 [Aldrovandia affinis]|uniref:Uncharacterized protein n=1 Tax=Aldrovandia affinis TaxID=143900 RepID=A0AAD7SKD6_9TELE|nr:hypothetical protein AAFF_G00347760 [Aldrovandia affinis]
MVHCATSAASLYLVHLCCRLGYCIDDFFLRCRGQIEAIYLFVLLDSPRETKAPGPSRLWQLKVSALPVKVRGHSGAGDEAQLLEGRETAVTWRSSRGSDAESSSYLDTHRARMPMALPQHPLSMHSPPTFPSPSRSNMATKIKEEEGEEKKESAQESLEFRATRTGPSLSLLISHLSARHPLLSDGQAPLASDGPRGETQHTSQQRANGMQVCPRRPGRSDATLLSVNAGMRQMHECTLFGASLSLRDHDVEVLGPPIHQSSALLCTPPASEFPERARRFAASAVTVKSAQDVRN